MKKIFLFYFLIPLALFSQGEFNHWHFGAGATLDFNSGSVIAGSSSSILTSEGSATISDCNGDLLFYSDGTNVWNKSNAIMTNGTGLDGSSGSILGTPSTQGALIVKRPETSGIYYIFTASSGKGLKYSIVNMNLNNGLGEVIIKNTLLSAGSTQKLAVTYHSNGKDIWVVTHYDGNNQYEAFLVTRTGVAGSGVSSFDGLNQDDAHGDIKISRDGSKIGSVVDFKGAIYLGDFNNSTGVVANTISSNGFSNPHGIEFSPDNSKMYINSTNNGVIQFSVVGSNLQTLNSAIVIGSSTSIYGSMQLGPDDRIYVTDANSSYLSVITNPNAFGNSCGLNKASLFIGASRAGYEVTNATLISPPSFNGPNSVLFDNRCSGDLTTFSLAVESDIVDVLWEFGDPNSILDDYSTKLSPEHEYTSVGTFSGNVVINYACGQEVINFTVVIGVLPIVDLIERTICSGVPTNIGVVGQPNISYSWAQSTGTGLSDINISNPTLTVTSNDYYHTEQWYRLVATDVTTGCWQEDGVWIGIVNPLPDAGPDQVICSGDTFEIGGVDSTSIVYSWSPAANVLSPNQTKTNVVVSNNGETSVNHVFTLTATLQGCTSTDDVSVEVKPLPRITIPKDTTICSLDSIVLNPSGNQNSTYLWTTAEGLSAINLTSPKFSMSNKDNEVVEYIKYVEMSINGCDNIDTVSVKVTPQAGIENYQYLCPGFGVELMPFGKGVNFIWTPNQDIDNLITENPIVNPLTTTTYYVNIIDIYGCSYNDSVLVDVNPVVPLDLGPDTVICRDDTILVGSIGFPLNAVFSWSPSTFLSNPDSNYTYAYPDSTLSYIVTSQSDTCFGFDTMQVTVNQLPLVNLASDSSICFRDSIYLIATGALNYTWSPNTFITTNNDSAFVFPQETINYVVTGVDTNGCVNIDTATISVRPLPIINLSTDSSVCFTDSIQVTSEGGGSYSWFPSEFVSDDTISNPFLIPDKTTQFIVTVLGLNNCSENDTIDVVVNALPVITMTPDTTICDGTKAYLWAAGGVKFEWSPTDVLNASNIYNPISSTTAPETYQVIVSDTNNCIDSLSTNILINVTPEADFEYSFIASCPGFDLEFTDKSAYMDSWYWSFGDGATSSEKSPNHIYEFGKSVTTSLVVSNNNYCFDTLSVLFDWKNLGDYITVSAPNIITPNGNKINDCFEIEIEGDFEDCTQIEVFNRWGMKVYDNTEFDTCFRGINEYNLEVLSAGTYFYVITINEFVKNGFIQVVR